ncbi:hypothetical protein RSOLAG22IIIB_12798 [Rhizoctonia solani]|uniref:Uncharacterized protein n=1 Tax=Rhizoctonia solani TaxID=456999 RepID=A0A0K6GGH4_9AGAM|nr:hypothetical protein RSOLAG22IIIB_12798 [Rhizoctonia solani]
MPRANRSCFEKRPANTVENFQPRSDLKITVNVSLCDYPPDNVQSHCRKYKTQNRVECTRQERTQRKSNKTHARKRSLHSGKESTEREGADPSRVNHPEKPAQASDNTQYASQQEALTHNGLVQYTRRVLEQLAEAEQAPQVGSEGSPASIVMLPRAPLGPGGRLGDRTLVEDDAVTEDTAMEAEINDKLVQTTDSARLAAEGIIAGCTGSSTCAQPLQPGTQATYPTRDNTPTTTFHSQPVNTSSHSPSGSLPQRLSPDDPLLSELVKELSERLLEWDDRRLCGLGHARIRAKAIIRPIIQRLNAVNAHLADADEPAQALGSESAIYSLQWTTCGSSPVPFHASLPGPNNTTAEPLATDTDTDIDIDTDTDTDVYEVPETEFDTESDWRATHNTPESDNAISVEEMNDLLFETARQESIRDHLEQIAAQELAATMNVDEDLSIRSSAPPSRTDASPSRSPSPTPAEYNEHGVLTARSKGKGGVN